MPNGQIQTSRNHAIAHLHIRRARPFGEVDDALAIFAGQKRPHTADALRATGHSGFSVSMVGVQLGANPLQRRMSGLNPSATFAVTAARTKQ